MKNHENSPVNEWNYANSRFGYLTGGPLDSLVAQLAKAGVSPPAVVAQMPVIAPASDAPETAKSAPSGNLEPTA